jgi:hypothetical protein
MNKKQLAEQAKKSYEVEFAKGKEANADNLKSLKASWDTAQAEADAESEAQVTEQELSNLITKSVSAQLDPLKAKFATIPDEKAIAAIVVKAMADTADKKNVGEIVTKSVQNALAECKTKSRFGYSDDSRSVDYGNGQQSEISRGTIEVKFSETDPKNLPLHRKQLLNVMMKGPKFMNEGIPDSMVARGEELGIKMLDSSRRTIQEAVVGTKSWGEGLKHWEMVEGRKALTSDASPGSNLNEIELSSILQRRLYLETPLGALFQAREIDMPVESYPFPLRTTLPSFWIGGSAGVQQNVATDPSDPGTAQPTLNSKKLMGETQYSYEADEASIIPILGFVEEQLAKGAAVSLETMLINGDLTDNAGTHMDADTIKAGTGAAFHPPQYAWDGFRKLGLDVATLKCTNSGNKAEFAMFEAMQIAMGKYALNPDSLVWIVGPLGMRRMKSIPQVQTMYAFGPNATIVTGKLERFDGISVLPSEWMREDVAATGVNTAGGPNTFGSCLLVRPDQFLMGRRRAFTIEIFRQPWTQTNRIIASFRRAFTPLETPSATIKSVAVGYNWI